MKKEEEAAAAQALQQANTVVEEDGSKYRTRPDGTRVKIVRKACPEGEALRTAVEEMAAAAKWPAHQLESRISGWGSEEQGLRSVWLLLRKQEKEAAKLEKLRASQKAEAADASQAAGQQPEPESEEEVKPWKRKKNKKKKEKKNKSNNNNNTNTNNNNFCQPDPSALRALEKKQAVRGAILTLT